MGASVGHNFKWGVTYTGTLFIISIDQDIALTTKSAYICPSNTDCIHWSLKQSISQSRTICYYSQIQYRHQKNVNVQPTFKIILLI